MTDQDCTICRHGVPIRDDHVRVMWCKAPLPEAVASYLEEPEHADARYTWPGCGKNCPLFQQKGGE